MSSVTEIPTTGMNSGDGSSENALLPESSTGTAGTDFTSINNTWKTVTNSIEQSEISVEGANAGLIVGTVILAILVTAALVLVYRRRKYLKKRKNNPYHVPIIEYKDDNISVSTFSSVGYGTYRDLEEYPIAEDIQAKIEGKLTLHNSNQLVG